MRVSPSWPFIVIALFASDAARAAESSNRFEQLLDRANVQLQQLDLETARQTLNTAMAWAESPGEYAKVWNLVGTSEGLDAHYGQSIEAFFRAARLGGRDSVYGVNHPQLPTRKMAECALLFEQTGMAWGQAKQRLIASLGGSGEQQSLDERLATELFAERFVCPSSSSDEPGNASIGRLSLAGPSSDTLMPTEVVVPSIGTTYESDDDGGPPVMTWVLGAMALAAVGTGATLGVVSSSKGSGAVDGADSSLLVGPDNGRVDAPSISNVAFAVAGGAALGAILFWVLDVGQDDNEDQHVVFPSGVQVRW